MVDGLLAVIVESDRTVSLEHRHDGCCPIRKLHWLDNVGLAYSVDFRGDLISKSILNGSDTKKLGASIRLDVNLDNASRESSHLRFE